MGWTPGAIPNLELGEIPHKGKVTDAQLDQLRKFAPDREAREAARQLDEQMKARRDDILSAGQESMDAYGLIDQLLENGIGEGIGITMPNFPTQVSDALANFNSSLDPALVTDVFYKRELRPMHFFFGLKADGPEPCFVIAPIGPWVKDQAKVVEQFGIEVYVVPDWLEKIEDGIYKPVGKSMAQARRDLNQAGFNENHEIVPT